MVKDFETFVKEMKLDEGLIKTYPIEKVVSYIQNKYNLTRDEIDIEQDSIIMDGNDIDKKIQKEVNRILNMSGYFKSFETGSVIYFDKKFNTEVFNDLKKSGEIQYLYHVSPSVNDEKIQNQGLVPKHKNMKYDYPERVYLLSDDNIKKDKDFLLKFCNHLHNIYKRHNIYSIYRIDFSKLNNMKLYIAPNAKDYIAYYTTDCIRPELFEKVDEIKLKDLNENKVVDDYPFHYRWYEDQITNGCEYCSFRSNCHMQNCSKDGYYQGMDEFEVKDYKRFKNRYHV